MNQPSRRTAVLFAVLIFGILLLFRSQFLTAIGSILVTRDQLQSAAAICLLNGEINTRPVEAARLWRKGLAPVILIARSEDTLDADHGLVPHATDLNIMLLEKLGVPRESIVQIRPSDGVSSTYEELLAIRSYVEQQKIASLLVVTSETHTRRTRWLLGRVMKGLPLDYRMAPVPDRHFSTTNWWQTEKGLVSVVNEYLKFVHNAVFR